MPLYETDAPDSPWQQVGRYTVLRKLAVGGMAELYLARASGIHGFEKMVVLKRVLPHLTKDDKFIGMFLDEARLAARLHHPNVAQVFDIGDDGGECFFTMEYVHGRDLKSIIKRSQTTGQPVPLELALGIITQAAAGLHYAHELTDDLRHPLGIVHRDVSPANILVAYNGAVKVIDFGVAKAQQRDHKTATGTIKGKVAYMSPEQCWGHAVDRRSDVFSLSTVLWELTVGRRLFYRDSDIAMMGAICFDDIPAPSTVVPGYSPALERIVMRGLQKEPDLRYPSAQAMQIELEELCRENKLSTSPIRRAAFMESLFSAEILSWRAAQKGGVSLAQHVSQLTPSATKLRLERPVTDSRVDAGLAEPDEALTLTRSSRAPSLAGITDTATLAPATRRRWPWAVAAAGFVALLVAIGVSVGTGEANVTTAADAGASVLAHPTPSLVQSPTADAGVEPTTAAGPPATFDAGVPNALPPPPPDAAPRTRDKPAKKPPTKAKKKNRPAKSPPPRAAPPGTTPAGGPTTKPRHPADRLFDPDQKDLPDEDS